MFCSSFVASLIILGFWFWWCPPESQQAATLIGLGGTMLSVVLDRYLGERAEKKRRQESFEKLKSLITCELDSVTLTLMNAKRLMDAALLSMDAALLSKEKDMADLTNALPCPMPFTDSIGTEILLLEKRQVNVLAALRPCLRQITLDMQRSENPERIKQGIKNAMRVLVQAFKEFEPEREINHFGALERAIELLETYIADANSQARSS